MAGAGVTVGRGGATGVGGWALEPRPPRAGAGAGGEAGAALEPRPPRAGAGAA